MIVKYFKFLLILSTAFLLAAGLATAATFLGGYSNAADVPLYDADKVNIYGAPDNALCWLAAASNVLAWSGWGGLNTDSNLGDGNDEEDVFSYLKIYGGYGNVGGHASTAWEDWFDEPGLGSYNFADYYTAINPFNTTFGNWSNPNYAGYADDKIRDYVGDGLGTVLTLQKGVDASSPSHAITLWGYEVVDENTMTVWITDSEDQTNSFRQQTMYLGYSLLSDPQGNPNEYYWDLWYMDYDRTGIVPPSGWSSTWWVSKIAGLEAYDGGGIINPPPIDSIPEPATIVLLGTGLLGLASAGRKRLKK